MKGLMRFFEKLVERKIKHHFQTRSLRNDEKRSWRSYGR